MSNPAGEGDLLRSGWQARSRQEKVGARDKMQPSLLDRLTDNDPEKKRESANSNLITHAALRRNVLRDLQWLFNTINHDASSDLSGLTQVSRSVVNFGVAPLAGKRMSDIEWHDIQRKLTEAIINFEPRILPGASGSLRVRYLLVRSAQRSVYRNQRPPVVRAVSAGVSLSHRRRSGKRPF